MSKKVSVVGLGKLGMCLAAVLAERGFGVIGVDIDQAKVDALNGGPCPLYERDLQETLNANSARLRGTKDYLEAVAGSEATFVVVPTPSEPSGGFSLRYVIPPMKEIGKGIKSKGAGHLVILTSTVMPGSMDKQVVPQLEEASGMKCGEDFGVCYNPEFIALGEVISGMLSPDMVLIGESDVQAGDTLTQIQKQVCTNSPAIARMSFVNAELAKISLNSFVTMKVSFANTLAEICERLPGGDVDKVSSAIGQDKRVGTLYLKGGMGYGGPCFPRDNVAFATMAEAIGAQSMIASATHQVNRRQVERLVTLAERAGLKPGMTIGILGLSYKPRTNIVEESQSVMLCEAFARRGFSVHAYDPAATDDAAAALADSVKFHNSSKEVIEHTDVCFIATPWDEFRKIDPVSFTDKILIDCWRIAPGAMSVAKKYEAIGIGPIITVKSIAKTAEVRGSEHVAA